jgi:hypothetical protein
MIKSQGKAKELYYESSFGAKGRTIIFGRWDYPK